MAGGERGGWEYAGRWGLVTGASSGIGEEVARRLASRGMSLVLAARREERLAELAEELRRAHGVEAVALPADLGKPGAAGVLWLEATDGREIHLVVNNAGFGMKGRFDELSLERQAEMVRLNCTAPMELTHLALPPMRARGSGGIVNVASVAAFQPIPELAVYAASKAFVLALSQAVAEEQRGSGVRVVALCPGPVATGFQEVAGTRVSERTPGIMTAGEVAEAALRALEAGRDTVVPGVLNRLGTVAGRVFPRSLVLRAAKTILKRLR
ncbi:MAG TPA: SDR family oxidoreductase [Longimicrobiaceae bacterium]|nr:SDR family oxidoreductase [Longimicrobiaceae bacterium]